LVLCEKQETLSEKINQVKRVVDMDKVVEYLPSNCEAQSSNSSTTKKEKLICVKAWSQVLLE
jgi:hypothetical protein